MSKRKSGDSSDSLQRAEEALRDSEERFRMIALSTPDHVIAHDLELRYTMVLNPQLGLTQEDMIGKTDYDILTREEADHLTALKGKVLETGKPMHLETSLVSRSGGKEFFDGSFIPKFDSSHRVNGLIGYFRNITHQKHTEEALRASEERYRRIIETTSEGIIGTDDGFQITFANKRIADLLGYRLEEVIGKDIRYFMFEEDMPDILSIRKERVQGLSQEFDRRFRRSDGSTLWTHVSTTSLMGEDGQFMGGFAMYTDIRDRKAAEEALRKSEERYRRIVETMDEGITVIDEEFRITFANRQMAEMLGYEMKEIIGKSLSSFTLEEDVPDVMARREALKQGFSGQYERRLLRNNGTILWTQVSTTPLMDGGSRFRGGLAMHTDITARKEAELDKSKMESQLRHSQKMEAIGTLAGGVAHDFNNILTAIVGFGGILQMDLEEGDQKKVYVDEIVAAAERAANLTQSLLAFSHDQQVVLSPNSIDDIIRVTAKLLKRLLTEDIALKIDLNAKSISAMVDITQIDQVLINLATNARDAMPGGGTLHIGTKVVTIDDRFIGAHGFGKPGAYVMISASDTGFGMDEATKEHIFEPFFTTKEVGKGTGLGLSTVYGVVKQHMGYVTVESVPNRGTIFEIYLPVIDEKSAEKRAEPEQNLMGTETILIAEDDRQVRLYVAAILQQNGYNAIEAGDGDEAVRLFFENRDSIDLAILDVVMPGKNGKEVYQEIRKVSPTQKIIFTSGYTRDVMIDKGVEDTMVDFIRKPMNPRELLVRVREVLDRHTKSVRFNSAECGTIPISKS
jgi:PAS domain S-box-containing protein